MLLTRSLVTGLILLMGWIGMARAQEQMSPVGDWQTFDESTGELKSMIEIRLDNGVISGRVVRIYPEAAQGQERCTKCTDDRKDQPVLGMEIIQGVRKTEGETVWEGGRILDPEEGRTYSVRLTPIDGGNKLQVRGSIGFLFRTQTWIRTPATSPRNVLHDR